MIITLWKLRPTEELHVLLKVRSGSGDNDEGRRFTIHSATSTSTGLQEPQCEYRRRRYGYFFVARVTVSGEW
jgi:hypothetical protein